MHNQIWILRISYFEVSQKSNQKVAMVTIAKIEQIKTIINIVENIHVVYLINKGNFL